MILQLLITFFAFLFSIWGLTALLSGVVLFLGLPLISTVSRFKAPAKFFLRLGAFPLNRAALVVSEHNDVLFKQMQFLNLGVEKINLDGDTKLFEDPDSALHYWLGIPFALADEEHGVLFDPRHAAAGMKKKLLDDRGDGEYLATTEEWEEYGVKKWKPAVFEFPKKHMLVNLSMVQEIIDGGERSEYATRVEELYQHSRDPFGSGTPAAKFLYPILGFAIPFGGIWFMASQFGVGGGASSSVSYAILALLLSPFGIDIVDKARDALAKVRATVGGDGSDDKKPLSDRLRAVDWKLIIGISLLAGVPLLSVWLLISVLGLIFGIVVVMTLLLGMAILPILTFIAKPSAILAGLLSKLYFRLGFLGFRRPVLEWTPSKYRLREYDQLDADDSDVTWYNLFGSLIGFTFKPGPESFGAEHAPHANIEAQQPVADGGVKPDSRLPAKYTPSEEIKRDTYGGYLPKRVKDNCYYLHTGILLNRFANSAIGQKSLRKLLEAKDEYGAASDGIDDSTVFKTTAVAGLLGAALGLGIFVLPVIL